MELNQFTILLVYFLIYSFLGWVLETVYKSILQRKYVNSGFVFGPFCPIYGFGAVILYLFLNDFKHNFVLVFIIGVIIFSIWECLVGYFLEKLFNTKYWDYSNEKFNFKGRICLRMSLIWGILGVLFIYVLHPGISKIIEQIPTDIVVSISAILLLSLIIDFVLSGIRVRNIDIKLSKLKDIQENLNVKLLKLKEAQERLKTIELKNFKNVKIVSIASKNLKIESVKQNIDELKQSISNLKRTESILRYKINKRIVRLRRAFPTMRSQNITEFLNQKLGVIKKDKKER